MTEESKAKLQKVLELYNSQPPEKRAQAVKELLKPPDPKKKPQ
jgi:hypothetical protein